MNPTADLLAPAALTVGAGDLPQPITDMQFIVTGEPDQDAAVKAAAALLPGAQWDGQLIRYRIGGSNWHLTGRVGRVKVTISAAAEHVEAATVAALTQGRAA